MKTKLVCGVVSVVGVQKNGYCSYSLAGIKPLEATQHDDSSAHGGGVGHDDDDGRRK